MLLGRRIRFLRKEQKLSQTQLGKKLNLAESTISLYESGKRAPDYETLLNIAGFFGVSLDYLFGLTDSRSRHQYQYEEDLPYFCEQSFLPDDVLYGSNNPTNPQNPPILLYRPQEALEGGEISRRGNFWYRVGVADSSDHGYMPGDLLLIDPCPLDPEAGDRMLVQLSPGLPPRFYRVAQYGDPTILMPLDPRQKPEVLTVNSRDKLPLFAKVLELRRCYTR